LVVTLCRFAFLLLGTVAVPRARGSNWLKRSIKLFVLLNGRSIYCGARVRS